MMVESWLISFDGWLVVVESDSHVKKLTDRLDQVAMDGFSPSSQTECPSPILRAAMECFPLVNLWWLSLLV